MTNSENTHEYIGITQGTYLVNVALLSETLILNVLPFWYYIQKQ